MQQLAVSRHTPADATPDLGPRASLGLGAAGSHLGSAAAAAAALGLGVGPSSSSHNLTPPSSRNPNFNIVFFALGFTLPCCAAQLVCALFTRIFDLDYIGIQLFRIMFAAYDTREVWGGPQ